MKCDFLKMRDDTSAREQAQNKENSAAIQQTREHKKDGGMLYAALLIHEISSHCNLVSADRVQVRASAPSARSPIIFAARRVRKYRIFAG